MAFLPFWRRLLRAAVLGAVFVAPLRAHLLNMTRVNITLNAARQVHVQVDVDLTLLLGDLAGYRALLTESPAAQAPRLAELGRQVLREIGLRLDGEPVVFAPRRWKLPEAPPDQIGDQMVAAMTVFEYDEPLPAGVKELVVNPGTLAKVEFPLAYTFVVPATGYQFTRWLELPGAPSRVFKLPEVAVPAPPPEPAPAAPARIEAAPPVPSAVAAPGPVAAAGPRAEEFTPLELKIARFVATVLEHLRLGFHHIFPRGIDHVLFVLGLFFLAPKWRPLLTQTTAFTIAHTTTLGLSAYGIVSLPTRVVEPLIALSIAYVAVENIWRPRLNTARIVVVFAFGLLHGLGFASSLSEVPMPRDQFFTALLAFNLGVDFGQLAVIAAAFLVVGWFRHREWYWKGIVVPVCSVIATIGGYWTVARLFA